MRLSLGGLRRPLVNKSICAVLGNWAAIGKLKSQADGSFARQVWASLDVGGDLQFGDASPGKWGATGNPDMQTDGGWARQV